MTGPSKGDGKPGRIPHRIRREGPSGLIPESFVPTGGPYRPGATSEEELSHLRLPPSVEMARKDDQPSIAAAPASISLSHRGPWGLKPGAASPKEATFTLASPFDDEGHQARLRDILKKGYSLPSEFTPHIKAIGEATENILHCMRTDPADVSEGDRFLKRYLVAALQLIDSYQHLATSDPDKARATEVGRQTLVMLERLEAAFKKEHADLLKNDVMSFSADVNTIDKLLKMEGH